MSALDKILPAPPVLANAFTGEVVDRDDVEAIKDALEEIEEYLDEFHRQHRGLYRSRDDLKARLGQLKPTDLPARRNQTDKQAKIERCPNCRTRLPRVVIVDAPEDP